MAPGLKHWGAAKHLLRYINATKNVGIAFGPRPNTFPHDRSTLFGSLDFRRCIDLRFYRDKLAKMRRALAEEPLAQSPPSERKKVRFDPKSLPNLDVTFMGAETYNRHACSPKSECVIVTLNELDRTIEDEQRLRVTGADLEDEDVKAVQERHMLLDVLPRYTELRCGLRIHIGSPILLLLTRLSELTCRLVLGLNFPARSSPAAMGLTTNSYECNFDSNPSQTAQSSPGVGTITPRCRLTTLPTAVEQVPFNL